MVLQWRLLLEVRSLIFFDTLMVAARRAQRCSIGLGLFDQITRSHFVFLNVEETVAHDSIAARRMAGVRCWPR